ncbi:MAG: MarR family transcriptional regulator [Thermoleophilia bacterium]|jgi:DNA-binding MarR family transcriptional regulator|nr:MarR family transcriptional regulator [Thermoleophilia bacterium]
MDEAPEITIRRAWALIGAVVFSRRDAIVAAAAEFGLQPQHAFALMRLHPDEPPSLRGLARQLHCDASYVTAIADRLEEQGYARRRVSASDRRVKELVLTPAGRRAQLRLRDTFLAPPPGLEGLTPEESAVLIGIARRLAEHADPRVLAIVGLANDGAPAPEPPAT